MIKKFKIYELKHSDIDPLGEENWDEEEIKAKFIPIEEDEIGMKKPKKYNPVEGVINYHDMMRYIDKKYDIDNRDYNRRFRGNKGAKYLDFWHWLLDHCFYEVHNPCSATLNVIEMLEEDETPVWVREILTLIKIEFGDQFNEYGELNVWISW